MSKINPKWVYSLSFVILAFSTQSWAVSITSLSLVDNGAKKALMTLSAGSVINLATLATSNLSVQAQVSSGVSKVNFKLDSYTHLEGYAPWFMCGDYSNCSASPLSSPGSHTITVTPYDSTGKPGSILSFTFSVVNQSGGSGGGGTGGGGSSGTTSWAYNNGTYDWTGDWNSGAVSNYASTAITCLTGSKCMSLTPTANWGMWIPFLQNPNAPNPTDTLHGADGIGLNINGLNYLTIAIYPTKTGFAPSIFIDYSLPGQVDLTGGNCVGLAGGDGSCPVNGNYGPNPMVPGKWNVYNIPITAFNIGAILAQTKGWIYKFALQEHGSNSQQTVYFDQVGFSAQPH